MPDGVGLRNFAFSRFYEQAREDGFEVVFWNHSAFDLSQNGLPEIRIRNKRVNPLTDILKTAKIAIELSQNKKRSGDAVYDSYRFPIVASGLKATVRKMLLQWFAFRYSGENGLAKLRARIEKLERGTALYSECRQTLERENPDIIFCTNQRPVLAIAPLLAAKDLGIPVATFIFSWDNLPKATKIVEADFYFVWSEHMKRELLYYYPHINPKQIAVTGTPQFEGHFDTSLRESRESFFTRHGLDVSKKYICYSGDDITTSPHDPQYLSDVADAIRELNAQGHRLGIIFRRCPVDFSSRFDDVLLENADIITPIAPAWKKMGEVWNAVLPTPEDIGLQTNTIAHTEMVINLGSSMVFDYVAFGKPCAFMNYDPQGHHFNNWSVKKIYNYVHFRSMPSKESVIWMNNPQEIAAKIESALESSDKTVKAAAEWFETINLHPPTAASSRIAAALKTVARCT